MRPLLALFAAAATIAAAGPALANQAKPQRPGVEPAQPATIEVVALPRLVCLPITRTGTRLNLAARCRTESEWLANPGATTTHSYWTIESAVARLGNINGHCGQCWRPQ